MSNDFTCITLSASPKTRVMPTGVDYYNHVKQFSDVSTLHNERLDSIKHVKTPFFFFCDDDDDIPAMLVSPQKAIVYGDNHYNEFDVDRVIKSQPWTSTAHLCNSMLIHRAVCNTKIAQQLTLILPRGNYWTENLLYYSLALVGGADYDATLKIGWNKKQNGFHTMVHESRKNSTRWLLNNQDLVKSLFSNMAF